MKAAEHQARSMTEADLQTAVQEMLTLYGWTWHHEVDSRKSRRGFPDLIAIHPAGHLLLIELKGYDARGRLGKVTDEQQQWLQEWRAAGARIDPDRINALAWEPSDLITGWIQRHLQQPRRGTLSAP